MKIPADLLYTSHDEWLKIDGNVVTIGVTDFAQDALGELVHIELPEDEDEVEAGAAVVEVESVKAVAEVYSPVDGKIIEVNEGLDGEEELVNTDPYGAGWLIKIHTETTISPDDYLSASAYKDKIS